MDYMDCLIIYLIYIVITIILYIHFRFIKDANFIGIFEYWI